MFIRVKRGKVQIGGRIKDHTEIGKLRHKHNKEQEKISNTKIIKKRLTTNYC